MIFRALFWDLPVFTFDTVRSMVQGAYLHPKRAAAFVCSLGLMALFGPVGAVSWVVLFAVAATVLRWVNKPLWTRMVAPWWRPLWRGWWIYRRRWKPAMKQCWLSVIVDGGVDAFPLIRRVRSSEFGDVVLAHMLIGHTLDQWERAAPALANTFGAYSCAAYNEYRKNGSRRVGIVRLEFTAKDALSEIVPPLPIPARTADIDFENVPIGRTVSGTTWRVPVLGSHLLVAGLTGSGKGSILWSIVRGLLPAIQDGSVILWGFDPKGGMELAFGRDLFTHYSDKSAKDMAPLLADAVTAMEKQQRALRDTVRKMEPTPEVPLNVVFIDEAAQLLAGDGEPAVAKLVNRSITRLVNEGRACGFPVIALLQDPRIEVIKMRDQFPEIVGMRSRAAGHTNMLFGPGALESGIRPHEIQKGQRGYGYAYSEERNKTVLVRASWISDDDIRGMAADYAPVTADVAATG